MCNPQTVNCRDLAGRLSTPLHFASGYNRIDIVEHLLKSGANVHAKDKGYTTFFIFNLNSLFFLVFSLTEPSYNYVVKPILLFILFFSNQHLYLLITVLMIFFITF